MSEVRDKTTYWIENNSAYKFHCSKEVIEVTYYSRVYPLGKTVSDWDDVKVGFGLKFEYNRVEEPQFNKVVSSFK